MNNYQGILGTLIFIFDILAIIAVLRGSGTPGHKVLWTLLILFLPLLGLVLYLLLGRGKGDASMM